MQKRKISLLIKGGGEDLMQHLLKIPYHKIYCLVQAPHIYNKNISNRVIFLEYKNENEWKGIIKKLVIDNPKEYIISQFGGDKYSRYSIYLHNQYSNNDIDWKIFRHKNKMNEFVGSEKKACHLSFDDLKKQSYFSLKDMLGKEEFIVKPINRSASAGAFKIQNQEDRNNIQSKLLHSDHVIEEYYPGHLHSVDFYFDGKNILVLCIVREVPFIETMDENKHSKEFLEQHGEEINKHFLYFLPIRYDVPYNKIHDEEWKFLKSLGERLKIIGYKGFIHLEYKFDTKTKKVGFIEWGARMGGWRRDRISKLHYFDVKSLMYDINNEDISKRKPYKGSYIFKDIAPDTHYIGIYKNFFHKTNIGKVLVKYNYAKLSFHQHIEHYFTKIGINIKNIKTYIKPQKEYFYPSFQGGSFFNIRFELDDENFKKFKDKKIKIIEEIVF